MKDDGGPAFPVPGTDQCYGPMGVSLRDWFAGQALVGLMRRADVTISEYTARIAYRQADAMLEARKR